VTLVLPLSPRLRRTAVARSAEAGRQAQDERDAEALVVRRAPDERYLESLVVSLSNHERGAGRAR